MTVVIRRKPLPRKLLAVLVSLLVVGLAYLLLAYGLLPPRYAAIAVAVLFVLNLIAVLGLLKWSRRRGGVFVAYLFALVVSAVSATGIYTLQKGYGLLDQITGQTGRTLRFSVVVLSGSPTKTEQELRGMKLAGATADKKYFDRIKDKSQASSIEEVTSYPELVKALYGQGQQAIILNEGFRGAIEEFYPRFGKETRVIATYTITEENKAAAKLNSSDVFNVYISGIDTYGDISLVSRSDVNIVATINPTTKQILLTTIPRDAYVNIAGGGNDQKDKLTHAGIYGVDSSIGTIEKLLGIKIDAYLRVNFTTVISLVDKIGGVDVENPVAFKTDSGEAFPAGTLHLNGKQALTFSRERHNLAGGDSDRGVNQQRVIVAIIKKVSSPSMLTNYQSILATVGRSIETNVSSQDITKFANMQLDYGGAWQIETINVKGRGQTGGLPSYAMPGRELYMYVLDPVSVAVTRQQIQDTLGGNE